MITNVVKLLLAFCMVYPVLCENDDNYCSTNVFRDDDDAVMGFTKEKITNEPAIVGAFKTLHCCAKGYRTIEWVKNDSNYPWSGTLSSFIISPKSANQTIYTQSISRSDKGRYTCILTNDVDIIRHTINLEVYEQDFVPNDIKITYRPEDVHASIGQPVRLFCEAFLGEVNLPDAQYEVVWIWNDTAIVDDGNVKQERMRREYRIWGSYLLIDKINSKNFGLYTCKITKPGKSTSIPVYITEKGTIPYNNPNPVPVKQLVIIFFAATLTVIFMGLIYRKYNLTMRVYLKDRTTRPSNFLQDVLIVYSSDEDETFVFMLANILSNRFGYICKTVKEPHYVETKCSRLIGAIEKSGCLLAVVSPTTIGKEWTAKNLYSALKNLEHFGKRLTCVLLGDVPRPDMIKNSIGETLTSLMKKIFVIQWTGDRKDEKFWLSLRLNLPPVRYYNTHPS